MDTEINRVRTIRESQGYSQDYVAAKLDLTQQAYSRIEKNPESASLKRLKQLSEILGVTLTTLIGEEDTYIQQNFQQQGGNASTVMYVTSAFDSIEKQLYEAHIDDLRKQIETLSSILKKQS
jgi:transcriptional regulator with XRE-family HTH domain